MGINDVFLYPIIRWESQMSKVFFDFTILKMKRKPMKGA